MIANFLGEVHQKLKKPFHILQTVDNLKNKQDTYDIVNWMDGHSNMSRFDIVSMDIVVVHKLHKDLEDLKLANYATFHLQDSILFLSGSRWIDVAFLQPSTLESGVRETQLAMSAGATLIVLKDYQTQAALAIKEAKKISWRYEPQNEYCLLWRE